MIDRDRLRHEVLLAFDNSTTDFRLTDSITGDVTHLGAGRAEVVGVLDELFRERVIRHPVDFSTPELEWWRLVKRGYTRGEKKRMFFALLGMKIISNGEVSGEY